MDYSQGNALAAGRIETGPIISRASTKLICIDDTLVAEVVRQIRSRFLENPGTAMLAHEQGIGRRALELRFRSKMGG